MARPLCLRPSTPAPHAAAICAVQNAAIVGLIFQLGSVPQRVQVALSAGLAGTGWWLLTGGCPPGTLTALQAGSVVLLALGGRLPQILLNLRRGGSGELSLVSCGLSLVGNLARVFTTAVLVRDPIILGSAGTQVGGWGGGRRAPGWQGLRRKDSCHS
jgi:hypothetical protein